MFTPLLTPSFSGHSPYLLVSFQRLVGIRSTRSVSNVSLDFEPSRSTVSSWCFPRSYLRHFTTTENNRWRRHSSIISQNTLISLTTNVLVCSPSSQPLPCLFFLPFDLWQSWKRRQKSGGEWSFVEIFHYRRRSESERFEYVEIKSGWVWVLVFPFSHNSAHRGSHLFNRQLVRVCEDMELWNN